MEEMLRLDVTEPSLTEWSSPVVIVRSQTADGAFASITGALNALCLKDSYPLPSMDECIDSLGDEKFFKALDCN